MLSLESSIDTLYRGALDEFVAARNALAKSLTGDAAHRVKHLQKPTSVAWAVNQLYWHRRSIYDRLIKSGRKLRAAQISALSGQRVNVREPGEEHRAAVAEAVAATSQLTAQVGLNPDADELSRTFEALSLESAGGEAAGRLSKALQPAGFEALAGLVVKAPARAGGPRPGASKGSSASRDAAAQQATTGLLARQREEAEANRQRAEAIEKAAAAVVRAQAAEDRARSEWERCQQDREAAERALADLQ